MCADTSRRRPTARDPPLSETRPRERSLSLGDARALGRRRARHPRALLVRLRRPNRRTDVFRRDGSRSVLRPSALRGRGPRRAFVSPAAPLRRPPPLPPGAGPAPGDRVGSKRQRSPPRYDRHDRDPHHLGHPDLARDRDRSPRRRRFDGPPGGGFHEGRRVVVRGRGRGRGPARDDEPLSFREFCVRHVSDAATPAEAERRYEQYKQEHAEAFRRRDFERGARDDPEIRAAHDPRAIEEAIERRAEMARDAARAFQSDLEAGKVAPLPPAAAVPAPAENAILPDAQSASSDEQRRSFVSKKDARGRWPVPAVAWAPERLRRDLRVLTTLVAALDAEKGVDGSSKVPRAAEPPESALDDGGRRAEDGGRRLRRRRERREGTRSSRHRGASRARRRRTRD